MGWLTTIKAALAALGGWFSLQNKKQERLNADDEIANANARRDEAERSAITKSATDSTKSGTVSEDERKAYAE